MFSIPNYVAPNFESDRFKLYPNVTFASVAKDGVAPDNYHATTIYPEYFKIDDHWVLAKGSRMDCVAVLNDDGEVEIKELRCLKIGEKVAVGRTEDGSDGIFLHQGGFVSDDKETEAFSFRSGRSRETSFSKDYEKLCDLLRYEKDHGKIVWVLGPAVVFDYKSRSALESLIDNGYAHAVFGGNAVATHDLEGAFFNTALGQDICDQALKPNGHYNHLDAINKVWEACSIIKAIDQYHIQNGIIYSCVKNDVPFVLLDLLEMMDHCQMFLEMLMKHKMK